VSPVKPRGRTVHEFDVLVPEGSGPLSEQGVFEVPEAVFRWLHREALRLTAEEGASWVRLRPRRGAVAVQVTNYVGVIRVPGGYQLEVLPKVGKVSSGEVKSTRMLLLDMLCCLRGFRHVRLDAARLAAKRMPLLEVFIGQFLQAVEGVVKSGLRGSYREEGGLRPYLRGRLDMPQHLRQNLCRRERFFVHCDEWSVDRPENRLLHSALRAVMRISAERANQQLARELRSVFADVPFSSQPMKDFREVCLDRGMQRYKTALDWARLILCGESPLTGEGSNEAVSLLFPMEALFEAFVARHLGQALEPPYSLVTQSRKLSLVTHKKASWFRLKPDLLVKHEAEDRIVLDTKWKLLDESRSDGKHKYGLSQADFYQLHAYGCRYLNGSGDIALIYPRTEVFGCALEVFDFPGSSDLRLWVVPFCLETRKLWLSGAAKARLSMLTAREPQLASAASLGLN